MLKFDRSPADSLDLRSRLNFLENGLNERDVKLNKRIDSLDEKLENIAEALGVKRTKTNNDDEDRKRLKERLMQAIEHHHKRLPKNGDVKESWISYIFGICEPNGRNGKQGSRYKIKVFTGFCSQRS
jgi:restriction endonuclease S subunit